MISGDEWVVMPAYNEAKNIGPVIDSVLKFTSHLVIVDDGSSDATFDIASKYDVDVLKHAINLGKGNALKTGCDYAVSQGAKKILVIDSDGQHDPKEIPVLFDLLDGVNAQIVFTYRRQAKSMPLLFKFGNWFIDRAFQALFRMKVRDTQCGLRAFTADTYQKVRWISAGYAVESEMIARTGMHKIPYTQHVIETIYNDKNKGTTPLDGIRIVLQMIWWRLTL